MVAKPLGMFSSFFTHPDGVEFANQNPNESIVLFLRRHFVTNIPWILFTVFFAMLPLFLTLLLHSVPFAFFSLPARFIAVLLAFYYLLLIGYAFSSFVSWFYNIGIVTTEKVVDINTINILQQNIVSADLSEVVDAEFLQRGLFQSYFDFGDVYVKTEALKASIVFDQAPKPSQVTDTIIDLRTQIGGE